MKLRKPGWFFIGVLAGNVLGLVMQRIVWVLFALLLLASPAFAQDVTYPNGMRCVQLTTGVLVDCVPTSSASSITFDLSINNGIILQEKHEHSLPEMVSYWTLGGLHVADVSLTMHLIGSGKARESGSSVMVWATEHPVRFAAIKWAGAGAGMLGTWWLFEHGHPTLAWLSIAGQAAITGYAVVHNARIYRICSQPGVLCR